MHGTVRRWVWALVLLFWTASAAADSRAVELTILQTVNLPWQAPEVIVVAVEAVTQLEIGIAVEGQEPSVHRLGALGAGVRKSVVWTAPAGSHSCAVTVRGLSSGRRFEVEQQSVVQIVPALELHIDEDDVDLAKRKVTFSASLPTSAVELTLYDMDGHVLYSAETATESPGAAATTSAHRTIGWPPLPAPVAQVALRVFSAQDTWADASWSPIEIEVPHEPILFDGAGPAASDARLAEAYAAARAEIQRHPGVPDLALYVVGVGPEANGKAVEQHAKAVARYLSKRGKLGVPVRHRVATDPTAAAGAATVHTILSSHVPVDTGWRPSP